MLFKFASALAPNAEGGDPSSPAGGVGSDATKEAPVTQADPWKALAESVGWRNPDEIKASLKAQREQQREQQKAIEAQSKQLQAMLPVMQQLQKIMPQLAGETTDKTEKAEGPRSESKPADITALKLAILELDVPVGKEWRAKIERLYKAEAPTDVDTWLTETVTMFGLDKKAEVKAEAKPVLPPPVVPDTGPAGRDPKGHLPDDILKMPPGVFGGLSNEEQVAYWEKYKRNKGMTVDASSFRSKPIIPKKG